MRFDVRLGLALVAGFVAGAPGGAWLAQRLSGPVLRWTFAAFLVVTAARALRARWTCLCRRLLLGRK